MCQGTLLAAWRPSFSPQGIPAHRCTLYTYIYVYHINIWRDTLIHYQFRQTDGQTQTNYKTLYSIFPQGPASIEETVQGSSPSLRNLWIFFKPLSVSTKDISWSFIMCVQMCMEKPEDNHQTTLYIVILCV